MPPCVCLTHRDHLQWSICFVCRGGISLSSMIEGSCGLRKSLSVHLSEGEKSNQIKSFVSLNNKPRSHTQQSLTPVAHTIAKAITSRENKEKRGQLHKILPCNARQQNGNIFRWGWVCKFPIWKNMTLLRAQKHLQCSPPCPSFWSSQKHELSNQN